MKQIALDECKTQKRKKKQLKRDMQKMFIEEGASWELIGRGDFDWLGETTQQWMLYV